MKLSHILPAADWLKDYSIKDFTNDGVAGMTVWIMLVPQGMAYALLAGMPPIYGLYGGLLPLLLYGLLGTSRQLSIGPVAVSALLVLSGISQIAEPATPEYISLVILTGLLIGLLQFTLGILRLGFLVNFLSHPVIVGFTAAAAIIIGVSQLKYLLGFPIPRFEYIYETVGYAFSHLSEIHWPSFLICTGGIVLILVLRAISRNIPGALLVTVLGILMVVFFKLDELGVKVVGKVPEGLPGFSVPDLNFQNINEVIPTVLTVTIIGIVESIGIAKVLEIKNKDCKVLPNKELIALGFSKIGGAFFQALPTSGSFTRSAVNDDAGAKTGMSSIITAILIGLTLIFLTPLFYYLPEAVLASIVLVAIKGLFNVKEAVHLWQVDREDFAMMMTTFVLTLVLGIEMGVLIGVVLSLILIIYSASKAHVAVLGQLPGTAHFRNMDRFSDAQQPEGLVIMRFDAQLFYGNVSYFKDKIVELVNAQDEPVEGFILDSSSIQSIDSTGLQALEEVIDFMHSKNIRFMMSGVIGPVRDLLYKTGTMEKMGRENYFMYIINAVDAFKESKNGKSPNWSPNAIQTNITKYKK